MAAKLSGFSAMRLGAKPEAASPQPCNEYIGLIDLPMPQKLTPNGSVCHECSGRRQKQTHSAAVLGTEAARLCGVLSGGSFRPECSQWWNDGADDPGSPLR